MKKTNKLMVTLIGTVLAGSLAGCTPQQSANEENYPPPRPQIAGYEDENWYWDEEDGEWEYHDPTGDTMYYYGGKLFKKSIKNNPAFKSATKSAGSFFKSGSSGKVGGFGSSSGGFFGG